jgi:hypothetical protein
MYESSPPFDLMPCVSHCIRSIVGVEVSGSLSMPIFDGADIMDAFKTADIREIPHLEPFWMDH